MKELKFQVFQKLKLDIYKPETIGLMSDLFLRNPRQSLLNVKVTQEPLAEKCTRCGLGPANFDFISEKGFVCLECKMKLAADVFAQDPYNNKWKKCNKQSYEYFIDTLGKFYLMVGEKSLYGIIDKSIIDPYKRQWINLLTFAKQEEKNYAFSNLDFSVARFERKFERDQQTMDFWLTLCISHDMKNYLDDLAL